MNICFRALSMQTFCNKRTDSKLEMYVKNALDNYRELYLRPIRISPCNFGVSFTDAHVKYTRYNIPPQNEKVHVKFSTVFHEGFETLDDHLKKNTGVFEITDVENELGLDRFPAVAALRMFLSEMRMLNSPLSIIKAISILECVYHTVFNSFLKLHLVWSPLPPPH